MQHHRLLPALAAILLSACFEPAYPGDRPCGADGWCPPGQDCIEMVCRLPGYVPPPPDAAVLDGAMPEDGLPSADNADLAELSLSVPGLAPAFTPASTTYDLRVSSLVRSLRVTASPEHPDATLEVAGSSTMAGEPSLPITVATTTTALDITVTAPAGNEKTYRIDVHPDDSAAQHVYGKADNAGRYDNLGWSVAIDGDTLAVSAPVEASCATGVHDRGQTNTGCGGSGAVYVFHRRGSVWELEAYLKPSNTDDFDEFGVSLALDGDTLVVGAFHEDGTLSDSGAAYVFSRIAGIWSEEAYLKPMVPQEAQDFGWSVAVSGDLIVVGARLEDDSGSSTTDSGAVYLFRRDQDGWKQEARLAALTPETDEFFGYSVSAADDVVVVGACGHGCPPFGRTIPSPQTAGTAYMFRRVATTWQQEADLAALASPSPGPGDAFGVSVALAGDTVVIGARYDDNSSSDSGAAHVFRNADDTWGHEAYLKATSTDAGDRFGTSVAIAGTLVAVGAVGEGDGNGAVYLYGRSGTVWRELELIKPSNTSADDQFGHRVALSDDALAVGAPYEDGSGTALVHGAMDGDDNGREDSGAVYLFH
jgi:trimeric autotransporter adhesin